MILAENRYILGGYGEIYEKTDSAVITEKPYAIKVLKTDSVYIAAKKILAYQKLDSKTGQKKSYMRAFKQARMFKTNAQGRSDSLAYNETDGVMHFVGKPIFGLVKDKLPEIPSEHTLHQICNV